MVDEFAHQSQAPVILRGCGIVIRNGTLFEHEYNAVDPEVVEGRVAALTPPWRSLGDIQVQLVHYHVKGGLIRLPFMNRWPDVLSIKEAEVLLGWIESVFSLAFIRSCVEVAHSLLIILETVHHGHSV